MCGDAHAVVAVNVMPLHVHSLADSVRARMTMFRHPVSSQSVVIPGAARAQRLDGLTHGDSPAEPQSLTMVFAAAGDELLTLSIRSWPRDDVTREVERIVGSLGISTH